MPLDETSGAEPAVIARAAHRRDGQRDWLAPNAAERVIRRSAGAPRRIRAGDVMILVRSRGAFFEAMIRALKAKGIPTAGADRLLLRNSHRGDGPRRRRPRRAAARRRPDARRPC